MKIIRGRLSAADVQNPSIRYNPDTNGFELTPDGGATWNPAPEADPRHSLSFLKPPVAGSSKQCDAAANMVKWLKDFIDSCIFDLTIAGGVAALINEIMKYLQFLAFEYATLLVIVSELAETIFGIGDTFLTLAFTSTEYDLLKCIFFCNADANGRISAGALERAQTDITAQLNTTAALVTNAILSLQGEIGVSNAGAIGSETGDCSACTCIWCYTFDFTLDDGGFYSNLGTWHSGLGWEADVLNGGAGNSYTYVEIGSAALAGSFTVTEVRWTFDLTLGTFDLPITDRQWKDDASTPNWYSSGNAADAGSPWIVDPGLISPTALGVTIASGYLASAVAKSGNVVITRLTVYGTGDNPFGENNC